MGRRSLTAETVMSTPTHRDQTTDNSNSSSRRSRRGLLLPPSPPLEGKQESSPKAIIASPSSSLSPRKARSLSSKAEGTDDERMVKESDRNSRHVELEENGEESNGERSAVPFSSCREAETPSKQANNDDWQTKSELDRNSRPMELEGSKENNGEASKVPTLPRRRGRPPKNANNSPKIEKQERNDRSMELNENAKEIGTASCGAAKENDTNAIDDAKGSGTESRDVAKERGTEEASGDAEGNVTEALNGEKGRADGGDGSGEKGNRSEEGDGEGSDNGSLGEGFYEVESVRKKRVRKGEVQYLIKWKNWPESANTWEPFDNVKHCAEIIEEFEASSAPKTSKKGRGKRKSGTHSSPQKRKRDSENTSADDDSNTLEDAANHNVDFTNGSASFRSADAGGETNAEKAEFTVHKLVKYSATVTEFIQENCLAHDEKIESLHDKTQALDVEETFSYLPLCGQETNHIHKDAKEDVLPNDSASSDKHHLKLSSEAATQGELWKDVAVHATNSHPEKIKIGEISKTSGIDKCTGAKKRKQGFVRRVRQDIDPQDEDENAKPRDNETFDEARSPKGPKPVSSEDRNDDRRDLHVSEPESSALLHSKQTLLPLTKILKAVNYSNSYVDGKHDVTVQFKVARADGRELLVDNKFMRANYPVLLIDFYEKHLRYSSSSAM